MSRIPRRELTSEREFLRFCHNGLTAAIGAYLRALRVASGKGWQDLRDATRVENILEVERGKRFPMDRRKLQRILNELRIDNKDDLIDLMIALQKFRPIIKKNRFKL